MKWEYKAVEYVRLMKFAYSDYRRDEALNELGLQRWELITIEQGIAIFKRPLIENKVEDKKE